MASRMALDGEVVIPKNVRDYLRLEGGNEVEFVTNSDGEIVMRKVPKSLPKNRDPNRFRDLIGSATIKWDPDELMNMLRGDR